MNKLSVPCVVVAGAFFASALSLQAKTVLYVDDDNYNPAYSTYQDYKNNGFDGSTEAKAYGTIQMAIDAVGAGSATAYNEIIVLPGTYDKGVTEVSQNSRGRCRLWVSDSHPYLLIRSKGGAAVTEIVGEKDSTTLADPEKRGCGDAAVKGIVTYWARGLRIQGFTIRDCATTWDANGKAYAAIDAITGDARAFVADCIISDCVAQSYVVANCSFFRTKFADNFSATSAIVTSSDLYCSILTRNCVAEAAGMIVFGHNQYQMINCTAVNNRAGHVFQYGTIKNTIVSLGCGTLANELAYAQSGTANNVTTSGGGVYQTIAPLLGDFRVIKAAPAETAGDAAHLDAGGLRDRDKEWFPVDWLHMDFNRNAIATSGTVMAGAVQETATPAGGCVKVAGTSASRSVSLEGCRGVYNGAYAYPTNYPVQWNLSAELPEGEEVFGYAYSDSDGKDSSGGRYAFPRVSGIVVVTPPPSVDCQATRTLEVAGEIFWADPDADMSVQDGSVERPYRRLCDVAKAIEGKENVIVKLKAGTYAEGTCNNLGMDNRFVIAGSGTTCRFVGVSGAEETIIKGAADGGSSNGCGENAIRVFASYSTSGAGKVQMQGLTLADGFTQNTSTAVDSGRKGLCYALSRVCFSDCVITNCGGLYEITSPCNFQRCKIVDCRPVWQICSSSSVAVGSYFENVSVAADNDSFSGLALYESTVVDTVHRGFRYGFTPESSVAFGCVLSGGSAYRTAQGAGNVVWNYGQTTASSGYVVSDPQLLGLGGPEMFYKTPAETSGACPSPENCAAEFHTFDGSDYFGNKLAVSGGKFASGACHAFVHQGVYVSAPRGGIAVGGGKVGYNAPDGELTLSVGAGERPCVGFAVGGVTNLYDEVASRTISPAEAASGLLVEALYSNEWRVRPDGNDSDFGFTTNTAFRTLAHAMTKAIAGDVVLAGPGVYAEGGAVHSSACELRSRVVMKPDVTLVSTDGPGATVILGENDSQGVVHGLGPKAMRCAYLTSNSRIKGFTLTGGRTKGPSDSTEGFQNAPHYHDDWSGGGALGNSTAGAILENCIVSNNIAYRGGGVRNLTVDTCRLMGNAASFSSPAAGESTCVNTLFKDNWGGASCYACWLYDCTFRGCWTDEDRTSPAKAFYADVGAGSDKTTVRWANVVVEDGLVPYHSYENVECPFCENVFATGISGLPSGVENIHGVTRVSKDDLSLGPDDRPIVGRSCLVDCSDGSHASPLSAYKTDAGSGQRVYNGKRDVGAMEADWRETYRKDIGPSRVVVNVATPGVRESDVGTVTLPEGESVWLTVRDRNSVPYLLRFSVPMDGSLSLTIDGDENVYGAGTHEVEIEPAGSNKELVLSSVGGVSEILKGRSLVGLSIVVR